MTNNTQNHVGETSAFTLPSPRKQQEQQEHEQQEQSPSTTVPLHANASTDEQFPSSENQQSPSLPWLVEYLSSSVCRAPEMVLDNLCNCKSAVDPMDIATNNSIVSETKNVYFDDTILRSDPKVDRSPTKISSSRWEALRAVVASHGDEYCDCYDNAVQSMPSIEETKEDPTEMNDANSIYPTKSKKRSLMDDSKDEDEEMEIADDDIREGIDQDLHTCQSFDHYIVEPSRRFLCAAPSTPTHQNTGVPSSPPTVPLPDRRRNRHPISPRTLGFQQLTNQRLTPPSPAPSADTYTTISLSQSFAREFDEDDSEHLLDGNLVLDRLASETFSPARSPFRRLRPRTTTGTEEKKDDEEPAPSTPTRKRSKDESDEQYRFLVRMSPDNYKHGKTSADWYDEFPKPEEPSSAASSVSSSVLLPLHPHQRIIEPLDVFPNRDYSFYPAQRRITVP
mmetsp:Transcript_20539/g.42290  ORF Transcript_20539/g.42290 Transcript_20539/m.42290 type:complete len:450 (-) Transcript_20539:73-1422(-)